MNIFKRRIVVVAIAVMAAFAISGGVAYAVFPDDNVTHYTGCLNTGGSAAGTFNQVAVGDSPAKACGSNQTLVHLSGGDITAVRTASGSGLRGGTDNGAASLSLDSTGCSNGGILKWNNASSSWACGTDNNTTYSGSDFALSNQNCANGLFDTGIDTSGHLTCAAPPSPFPRAWAFHSPDNQGIISDYRYYDVASLLVPAGSYTLAGSVAIVDVDHNALTNCFLFGDPTHTTELARQAVTTESEGVNATNFAASLSLVGAVRLDAPTTVAISCRTADDGVTASDSSLVATQVSSIN
jgi:hypothetical protein